MPAQGEPPGPGGVQRRLADRLIFDGDEELTAEQQPLAQEARAQNRERFERNRRTAAQWVFYRTASLVCIVGLLVVAFTALSVYFYITGWFVWAYHHDEPCDQPLETWLLITLLLPMFYMVAESSKALRVLVLASQLSVLIVGIVLLGQCETCKATNPILYTFVGHYMIFLSISWACAELMPFILLAVLIYGLNNGWFDDDDNGADPETIKNLETIKYDPALFAEVGKAGDSRPPAECCCCCEPFDAEREIKKTPCTHYFHEECLEKWLRVSTTCPLCRKDLQEAVLGSEIV